MYKAPTQQPQQPQEGEQVVINFDFNAEDSSRPLPLPSPPSSSPLPPYLNFSFGTKQQRKGTRRTGRQHWAAADLDYLLSLIDQNLPLCKRDWGEIEALYNANYAEKKERAKRTSRAIQEKFESLCNGTGCALTGRLSCFAIFLLLSCV
mmetsp:Transcript_38467/g.60963  ORF Transcript_38467/g.60963 Transcript_38467/m.60963 type:complete len:149 (-) Transcript_38467:17-463(-)